MAPYKHQVRSPFWLRVLSCTPFEADSTSASTTETDLGISDRHLLVARWDKGTTLQALSLFLLFTPSISSSAPVFSCSVSSYCLQSCAGCCCGFSFRVVFKMADSNNSTLTKRTGGFFYSWTCCEDACARSHTHTSTLERGTLMCFDDGELILFISHCRSKPADETGI